MVNQFMNKNIPSVMTRNHQHRLVLEIRRGTEVVDVAKIYNWISLSYDVDLSDIFRR